MTQHLSDEEIAAWAMGEGSALQKGHVAECQSCRAKTGDLQKALTGFRETALLWATREHPPAVIPAVAREKKWRGRYPPLRWVLACGALVGIAAVYESYSGSLNATRERAAQEAAADSALLSQVDKEISRAVPEPMEPLLTLVSWNTGSGQAR
jgi:hypothetical protein